MCAVDLPNGEKRDKLRDLLYQDGLIILSCGDQSIRFRPHLNVKKEELDLALEKMENALGKL
jgi:L-lysine 6-transaminase